MNLTGTVRTHNATTGGPSNTIVGNLVSTGSTVYPTNDMMIPSSGFTLANNVRYWVAFKHTGTLTNIAITYTDLASQGDGIFDLTIWESSDEAVTWHQGYTAAVFRAKVSACVADGGDGEADGASDGVSDGESDGAADGGSGVGQIRMAWLANWNL